MCYKIQSFKSKWGHSLNWYRCCRYMFKLLSKKLNKTERTPIIYCYVFKTFNVYSNSPPITIGFTFFTNGPVHFPPNCSHGQVILWSQSVLLCKWQVLRVLSISIDWLFDRCPVLMLDKTVNTHQESKGTLLQCLPTIMLIFLSWF